MDRMAQTALNSMKMLMENQMATAHNLSNLNTPGFRQDVITDFSLNDGMFVHKSASIIRTARKLAEGKVFIPTSIWDGDST